MPGKLLILNAVGIVLQYMLIVLLYYFLFKVIRLVYLDLSNLHGPAQPFVYPDPATAAGPESAKLVVIDVGAVKLAKSEYKLGETISIGRGEGNDIIINDNFVSHEHACITRYKHGFWLTDLQSTNGTFVNNRQITEEVRLEDGDIIAIGAVVFRFER